MTSLTDSVTAIEAELATFDAATTQLEGAQVALVEAQANIESVIANQAIAVSDRATQLVTLKATVDVLQSDVNQQGQALATLRAQIIADATDLQSRLRGEIASKVAAQTKTVLATLQTDYDVRQIRFPLEQIAAAHNSVLAFKNLGTGLNYIRAGDGAYIDFARNAGAILTQIG